MFISITNRPIDKFYRLIFHKAVSIFGKDLEKNVQLTFLGHPVYYELYSCCKYSWVFKLCFNQFFCITLDNKDVASLTLLGVSYRFLAADDENQC